MKRNYNLNQYWVEINIEDLSSFDEVLAEKLYKKPTEHLPILEEAAKEVCTLLFIIIILVLKVSWFQYLNVFWVYPKDLNTTPYSPLKPWQFFNCHKMADRLTTHSMVTDN